MDVQSIALEIIAESGDSCSSSMEAIECMKDDHFDEAEELLKKAEESLLNAHRLHTDLLCAEANGEEIPFSMFLMHSESHLNMAQATKNQADTVYYILKEKVK